MNQPFLVGIASDFYLDAEGRIEDLLAEELGSIAGLDYRTLNVPPSNIASPESLQPFDAILCLNMRIAAESLVGNDRLALVAKWGVGCENLDLDAISRAGIAVTATPQAVKRPAAESIFTLIFALAKNLVQQDRLVRGGGWRNELAKPAVDLRGSVLGSIGCGNIGREMFQLAQGWGFRCLLAYDPYLSQSDVVDLGVELVDLDTLCRETDFLAINAPLTAETTGMMGVRQFRLMKRSAYLVNTSCEPIAAHPALVQALQEEWIAGAGLDVFPMQPPSPDDPIFNCPNLILLPQSLAWTEDLLSETGKEACRNILQVGRGATPEGLINRSVLENPKFQEKLDRCRYNSRI